MLLVMFFQALQSRKHRRILLRLAILGAEGVVAQRIQANSFGLVRIEIFGIDRAMASQQVDQGLRIFSNSRVRTLRSVRRYRRHCGGVEDTTVWRALLREARELLPSCGVWFGGRDLVHRPLS